jgi:hypothetical protein
MAFILRNEKTRKIPTGRLLVCRDSSVMVLIATSEQAILLGIIGAILTKVNQGEVIALQIKEKPAQYSIGEGRISRKEVHVFLEIVIVEAKPENIFGHTIIRLEHEVAESVDKTVERNATHMLVLSWASFTNTSGRI